MLTISYSIFAFICLAFSSPEHMFPKWWFCRFYSLFYPHCLENYLTGNIVGAKSIYWLTEWLNKLLFRTLLLTDRITLLTPDSTGFIAPPFLLHHHHHHHHDVSIYLSVTVPQELYSLLMFSWDAHTPIPAHLCTPCTISQC